MVHGVERFSIVMQGRIDESVLSHAKHAQTYSDDVIVSTWTPETHQDRVLIEKLQKSGVSVITSVDPGSVHAYTERGIKKTLNVNRQLRGISAGAKLAKYDRVIKSRTDISIDYSVFNEKWVKSKRRFASLHVTSVNPNRLFAPPFLYHVCDWCVGSSREDYIERFDTQIDESRLVRDVPQEINGVLWNTKISAEQALTCILIGEDVYDRSGNMPELKACSSQDFMVDAKAKSLFANINRDRIDMVSAKYKARSTRWLMYENILFEDAHWLKPSFSQFVFHMAAKIKMAMKRKR